MPIPDYETIMLPLLKFASDSKEYSSKEAVESLSKYFKLKEEEKNKLYPTKKVSIFYDRTHWALTYLKHAGLLTGTRRGFFKITERGKQILSKKPIKIDDKYLKQFPEFIEFQKVKTKEENNKKQQKMRLLSNKMPHLQNYLRKAIKSLEMIWETLKVQDGMIVELKHYSL